MDDDLLRTFEGADPARVVDLYPQLHARSFVVRVNVVSEADLETAQFIIYPCTDPQLGALCLLEWEMV